MSRMLGAPCSEPIIRRRGATGRADLLSIGEAQIGFRWQGRKQRHQPQRPFLTIAMEGQIWHGAGNATSEDGALGFFGLSVGAGVDW